MCIFCNGDTETQEPLKELEGADRNPILTIISSKSLSTVPVLSVILNGSQPKEILYHCNYCPMCGREL